MITICAQGEFWLGLEVLHKLTLERDYKLHIILKDFDNKIYMAVYDYFKVLSECYVRTKGK